MPPIVRRPGPFRGRAVLLAGMAAAAVLPLDGHAGAKEEPVSFEADVRPILGNRCMPCHDPDRARGGLDLSRYDATLEGSSGGDVVVPGDPDGSVLVQVIAHTREPFMPPSGDRASMRRISRSGSRT